MTKENQSLGGNMEEQECEVLHEETVENVKKQMLDEDILFDVSDFFKMLGDSTRAKIMWALDKHEMCVCDLAALLGMTKSAISHQLKTLREANLVKFKKEGKNVRYTLDDDHVKDIFEKALEHVLERRENM